MWIVLLYCMICHLLMEHVSAVVEEPLATDFTLEADLLAHRILLPGLRFVDHNYFSQVLTLLCL